jgi:hypothetical protein
MALGPARAFAERGAFTLEGGGAVRLGSVRPSVGAGDAVTGTIGGAVLGVRYGFTNRLELQGGGFWYAPATFAQPRVTVSTPSGDVSGALTQDVSRWGAAVGVRYAVAGLVWRIPVGFELGWAHTRATNRDLLDTSDPRAPVSRLSLADGSSDALLLAPFAGLEWLATDHLRFSIVPRLEMLVGAASGSTLGVVVPFTVGWSLYWFPGGD